MKIKLFIIVLFSLFFALNAFAADTTTPELKIYDQDAKTLKRSFLAFDQAFIGGGNVAIADLNDDKKAEIVVGAGTGGGPQVKVFSPNGKLLGSFFAFDQNFHGGVDVAVGNVRGDKNNEIIVSQASEGEPWVKVFKINRKKSPWQFEEKSSFLAYASSFHGGVNVAAANLFGTKKAEIVTASGMGSSGHIRTFDWQGNYLGWEIFPYSSDQKGGADVAVGNVDGGAESEVITSILHYGEPRVKVYKTDNTKRVLGDFLAFSSGYREGVNVSSGDIDSDGMAEVLTSTNGGGPQVRTFEAYGKFIDISFFPYAMNFHGGVKVGIGNTNGDKKEKEIITMPGRKTIEGRGDLYKYIEVDVGEQTLRAYLAGKKVNEFLVSTGVYKYPTPIGDFKIYRKTRSERMKFEYGPNDLDNYDLPNVPNVMYFDGPYSLHGTYWHNNFGQRMSHGCVNLSLSDAAWAYDWANYGDVVLVRP